MTTPSVVDPSGHTVAVRRVPYGRHVEITARVPSAIDVVEDVVDGVARHCVAGGVHPRTARFNLRVVLSEALTNAILYGNRMDPAKYVEVQVRVEPEEVSVRVRDEGEGFNPDHVPDPTRPERLRLDEGRGLFVIRQLADEVQFNDRGNSICMIMRRA